MKGKRAPWHFGPGEQEFFTALKGQKVAVKLMTGELFEGVIIGVDTYHVTLLRGDGMRVVLYKHAIAYFLTREELESETREE